MPFLYEVASHVKKLPFRPLLYYTCTFIFSFNYYGNCLRSYFTIMIDLSVCLTELATIIGYLQTFPHTIIAEFSRKWPTTYDNHYAPVNQEYHRNSTMSLCRPIDIVNFFSGRRNYFFHRCSRIARRPHMSSSSSLKQTVSLC